MSQNYGLGRGLASLIPQKQKSVAEPKEDFNYFGTKSFDGSLNEELQSKNSSTENDAPSKGNSVQEIEIIRIVPNPHQPRLNFDQEKLKELSDSIKKHGIIQPIVVTKENNQYEIIAGERRFQASKLAGLKTIPAIIREASEQQKLELAIIENIQRHNLNSIEEAKSYRKLEDDFDMSQEEVALKVGKSRSAVANKTRLLNLPIEIQKALIEEKITEGHAKAILALENPEKQRALFEIIIKNNLTVRQTEDKTKEVSVKTHKRMISVDPETKEVINKLIGALGTKVKISKSGDKGKIMIDFYSKEEFNDIVEKISS